MKNLTVKRLLSLLLAAVMVLGILTACGKKEEAGKEKADEGAAAENSAAESAKAEEATPENILARDYSEHLKISYAGWPVTEGLDYTHGNDYYSWWADTFNVEWDVTGFAWDNWDSRINTWAYADDLPDWCVWNFNPADAKNWVDQGLVKQLPEDWKEKYPNLAKQAEWAEENAYYEELYGGTYFLFRPLYASNFPTDLLSWHHSVYLRADWAEQAGFDLTKQKETHTITISEWLDYMRAVKDAGLCEYPWYATTGEITQALGFITDHPGSNSNVYYKGEDGKYHWGPAEESCGVKEGLSYFKTAYDEGLIHPEFFTLTGSEEYYNVTGEAATCLTNGLAYTPDWMETNFQTNLGISFYENGLMLALVDDDGVYHGEEPGNYWGVSILNPNISDEKLERLLNMWDYACTEEGYLRIFMGVPEVDWTRDSEGNLVSLLGDQYADLNEKYESTYPILSGMFLLDNDFGFVNPATSEESRTMAADAFKARAERANYRGQEKDFLLATYSSQAMSIASLTYYDEYANLILKEGNFSDNYDQWVQEKLPMIEPLLKELDDNIG